MVAALHAADFAKVGALFSENWRLQQLLDPGMSTPEMARLEHAMLDAGALGGKAAGSGAGGSMFFLAPDDPSEARRAVGRLGMRLLPVRWALMGVRPC
jgi:galactokinase/mevalonate kinase-like predicted kinase